MYAVFILAHTGTVTTVCSARHFLMKGKVKAALSCFSFWSEINVRTP